MSAQKPLSTLVPAAQIAVDAAGWIYAVREKDPRVYVYNPAGVLQTNRTFDTGLQDEAEDDGLNAHQNIQVAGVDLDVPERPRPRGARRSDRAGSCARRTCRSA